MGWVNQSVSSDSRLIFGRKLGADRCRNQNRTPKFLCTSYRLSEVSIPCQKDYIVTSSLLCEPHQIHDN